VVAAKEVLRTFSTKGYTNREPFLYVNIIQEDKRINIDGDNRRSIKSSESNTNTRKTRTTRREEGCIGGSKDSSVRRWKKQKERSLIIDEDNETEDRVAPSSEGSIDKADSIDSIDELRRRV